MNAEELAEWERLALAAKQENDQPDSEWKGPASFALVNFSNPDRILELLSQCHEAMSARRSMD